MQKVHFEANGRRRSSAAVVVVFGGGGGGGNGETHRRIVRLRLRHRTPVASGARPPAGRHRRLSRRIRRRSRRYEAEPERHHISASGHVQVAVVSLLFFFKRVHSYVFLLLNVIEHPIARTETA